MGTCWLAALDSYGIDVFIEAMGRVPSPGCAIFTHEFRGAASRVPTESTAFGLRRDHVLVEIFAAFDDRSNTIDELQHRQWVLGFVNHPYSTSAETLAKAETSRRVNAAVNQLAPVASGLYSSAASAAARIGQGLCARTGGMR